MIAKLSLIALALAVFSGCSSKETTQATAEPPREPAAVEPPTANVPATNTKTVYFDTDSARLGNDAKDILKGNAEWLKGNPAVQVRLDGHCDERGSVQYNKDLGKRRALAVRDYLVKAGVSKKQLSITSYGKDRPVASGSDESSWAQNRRVETNTTTNQLP